MHAENCVVLRVTARGNQTRGKDAAAVEQEEKGMRGGSGGGGGGVGLAVAEGSFTCCRCAPFLFFFFFTFHIRPAHMPQAGASAGVGRREAAERRGAARGVGFARRAVRKYVANSTAH